MQHPRAADPIKATLRRADTGDNIAPTESDQTEYHFGEFSLNLATRSLQKHGHPTPLTSDEFAVLSAMIQCTAVTLTRNQLLHLTSAEPHASDGQSIDIHISRLRKLTEAPDGKPRLLKAVWGVGYTFVGTHNKAPQSDQAATVDALQETEH